MGCDSVNDDYRFPDWLGWIEVGRTIEGSDFDYYEYEEDQ